MTRTCTVPLVALLGLALSGCTTLAVPVKEALPDWMPVQGPRGPKRATKANPVTQVAGFWQPAEDTGPNGRPVRGFAGKILLFPAAARGDEPIAARGAVRVSLYDQTGNRDVLIHQYDLPPDAWETHLAHSNLGVGYEVFLPYMSPDPRKVRCGLRVRFVPEYEDGTAGRPVFSAVETCSLDTADSFRRNSGTSAEVVATRHGLRTETIRPVAIERTAVPQSVDSGVVPASAERPAEGASPSDGLDPEMRARIEQALAGMKRRNALEERAAATPPNVTKASVANAAARAAASPAPATNMSSARRFTFAPADGTGGSNPDERTSHPLMGD